MNNCFSPSGFNRNKETKRYYEQPAIGEGNQSLLYDKENSIRRFRRRARYYIFGIVVVLASTFLLLNALGTFDSFRNSYYLKLTIIASVIFAVGSVIVLPFVLAPLQVERENRKNTILEMRKQELRRLSVIAGGCVLGFIALENIIGFFLAVFGLEDDYQHNLLFQNAVGILFSVFCVFLPFLIAVLFMDRRKKSEILLFGKPYAARLMLLAVPAGFLFCLAGDYATNYLVALMDSVGIKLISPPMPAPETVFQSAVYVVQIAFVPALVEEFALRGVIMQPLRKYGDRFAIVMSSVVFALMHGNMVQAPFAFIAGIAIGYFVIATGSIWTGVLIHFTNNLYSAILTVAVIGSANAGRINAVILTEAFVFGIVCNVFFFISKRRFRLRKMNFPMRLRSKVAGYIITVPMIAALIAIAFLTSQFIEFGG